MFQTASTPLALPDSFEGAKRAGRLYSELAPASRASGREDSGDIECSRRSSGANRRFVDEGTIHDGAFLPPVDQQKTTKKALAIRLKNWYRNYIVDPHPS